MTQKEIIVGFAMASNLRMNDLEKRKLKELVQGVFAGAGARQNQHGAAFKKLNEKLTGDLLESVYFAATLNQKWLTFKVFLDTYFEVANNKIEKIAATLEYPLECANSGEAWRKHLRGLFFGALPDWAFYGQEKGQK